MLFFNHSALNCKEVTQYVDVIIPLHINVFKHEQKQKQKHYHVHTLQHMGDKAEEQQHFAGDL